MLTGLPLYKLNSQPMCDEEPRHKNKALAASLVLGSFVSDPAVDVTCDPQPVPVEAN
jgi:hypothetical protein